MTGTARKKRVLVVDDEELFRMSLADVLSARTDLGVAEAANGREALRVLDGTRIDCVVTDLSMPEIDGVALLVAIHERRLPVSVVVLSAYITEARPLDEKLSLLPKPVALDRLFLAIDEAIEAEARVTLAGLVRLAAAVRRAVVFKIRFGEKSGELVMRGGEVVDAFVRRGGDPSHAPIELRGTCAAVEMLSADAPNIELGEIAANHGLPSALPTVAHLLAMAGVRRKLQREAPASERTRHASICAAIATRDGVRAVAWLDWVHKRCLARRGGFTSDEAIATLCDELRLQHTLDELPREETLVTFEEELHLVVSLEAGEALVLACDPARVSVPMLRSELRAALGATR